MIKDFILNTIIRECINIVAEKEGDSFSVFNLLPINTRKKIIEGIVDNQSKAIVHAMENKEDIRIPHLGTFKIKQGRVIALELRDKVLEKYNVIDYDSANDELKEEINKEHRALVRLKFMELKKTRRETRPFNSPIVSKYNFRKKRRLQSLDNKEKERKE